MRVMMKRINVSVSLVILLIALTGVSAAAETGTLEDDLNSGLPIYGGEISIQILNADGTSKSETLVNAPGFGGWQTPRISYPYDYEYQDAFRYIVINRFVENDVTYFVADVQLANAAAFKTALSSDKVYGGLEPVSAIAARNQAIFAINADNYGVQKFGTIIRNGTLIRSNTTTRNMLIVDQDGGMSVISDRAGENPTSLGQQLLSENVWHTFEFGPELVRDGQAVSFNDAFDIISTSSSRREPRTAIGQIDALHYLVIVADGRQTGYSIGMTLPELQDLFVQYGAKTAMNLDGGGSSVLWFQGQVLNRPAGGDERYVSDIIYF